MDEKRLNDPMVNEARLADASLKEEVSQHPLRKAKNEMMIHIEWKKTKKVWAIPSRYMKEEKKSLLRGREKI